MTLPQTPQDARGAPLKLRVSKHAASSWTWSLVFDDDDHRAGGSGYSVLIEKGHPVWEAFTQVVGALPLPLRMVVRTGSWFWKLNDKHCFAQVRLEVPDEVAMVLSRELWLECTAGEDIDEDDL